jgi:hypothetical protein
VSFEMEMKFEAFVQMVMHVCSWLMRVAELSKWILLSSKKLWGRRKLLCCVEDLCSPQCDRPGAEEASTSDISNVAVVILHP